MTATGEERGLSQSQGGGLEKGVWLFISLLLKGPHPDLHHTHTHTRAGSWSVGQPTGFPVVEARLPTQIACVLNSSVLLFSSPLNSPPLFSTLSPLSSCFLLFSLFLVFHLSIDNSSGGFPLLLVFFGFPLLNVFLSSLLYTPSFPSSI